MQESNESFIESGFSLLKAALHAVYEVAFVLVPVAAWILIIYSTGGLLADIHKLPAWAFAALSLFTSTLRDGISAFDRASLEDRQQRDLVVVVSLIGVVLSTVLLALSALRSNGTIQVLFPFFYETVFFAVAGGTALLFVKKAILLKRKYGKNDA